MKVCNVCQQPKDLLDFKARSRKNNTYYYPYCFDCLKEKNKNYKLINKEKISKYEKLRYLKNRGKDKKTRPLAKSSKEYYLANRDKKIAYQKIYYSKNIAKIRKQIQKRKKERKKTDPVFRIKLEVSRAVYSALKKINSDKQGQATFNHLPYNAQQLKAHLESKFESWMNWNNWAIYNKDKWNDQDSSTWTWNIDHIIPQSKFYYTSLIDDDFRKCWALDNLRPYSAKQNILDNSRR